MLSICIGIYNWDVSALVSELSSQADSLGIDYEIVLVDDASDESYLIANEKVRNNKNVVYILNDHNIGRAAIRNKLADAARFPYLLFMDCDTTVTHDDLLMRFLPRWFRAVTSMVISRQGKKICCVGSTAVCVKRLLPPSGMRIPMPRFRLLTF